jgi:hypothetical protein
MRIACWISKATNTYSQHVTLITVPLQQWLQEGASVLRRTYIACLRLVLLRLLLLFVTAQGVCPRCATACRLIALP